MNQIKKRFLHITLVLFIFVAILVLVWHAWEKSIEADAHIKPDIEKQDIRPILLQQAFSEDDYRLLLRQTGLGRQSIDALRNTSLNPILDITGFQEGLFEPVQVTRFRNSPISKEERLVDNQGNYRAATRLAPLENGDILITKSSHVSGWRNGHAAIVVDAENGKTLESVVLGTNSAIQSVERWLLFPNFIVLRLGNATLSERQQIAGNAAIYLNDIPYDFMVGLTTPKNQPAGQVRGTQCSHLVWQAYYFSGVDLDSDGGRIVTPKDIANSPLLEIVQVYGVDPDRIWP